MNNRYTSDDQSVKPVNLKPKGYYSKDSIAACESTADLYSCIRNPLAPLRKEPFVLESEVVVETVQHRLEVEADKQLRQSIETSGAPTLHFVAVLGKLLFMTFVFPFYFLAYVLPVFVMTIAIPRYIQRLLRPFRQGYAVAVGLCRRASACLRLLKKIKWPKISFALPKGEKKGFLWIPLLGRFYQKSFDLAMTPFHYLQRQIDRAGALLKAAIAERIKRQKDSYAVRVNTVKKCCLRKFEWFADAIHRLFVDPLGRRVASKVSEAWGVLDRFREIAAAKKRYVWVRVRLFLINPRKTLDPYFFAAFNWLKRAAGKVCTPLKEAVKPCLAFLKRIRINVYEPTKKEFAQREAWIVGALKGVLAFAQEKLSSLSSKLKQHKAMLQRLRFHEVRLVVGKRLFETTVVWKGVAVDRCSQGMFYLKKLFCQSSGRVESLYKENMEKAIKPFRSILSAVNKVHLQAVAIASMWMDKSFYWLLVGCVWTKVLLRYEMELVRDAATDCVERFTSWLPY